MKTAAVLLLAAALIIGANVWAAQHDYDTLKMSKFYEHCIAVEYSTTPVAYRIEHGDYPTCRTTYNAATGDTLLQ